MIAMNTMWSAVAVVMLSSSVLSEEMAKERHRDRYFYFFAGLLVGPLALLAMLTPVPGDTMVQAPPRERTIRVVDDIPCPDCGRQVPARARTCPYCNTEMIPPLWDKLPEIQPPYIEVVPRRRSRRRSPAVADVPLAEPVSLVELEGAETEPHAPVSLLEMDE
ncbi:MAG: zinc ribbon domain-containing protein [Actinomycetota bacterium]